MATWVQDAFRASLNYYLEKLGGRGVTAKMVAKAAGMSQASISQLRHNRWCPHLDTVAAVLDALNSFLPEEERLRPKDLFRSVREIARQNAKDVGERIEVEGAD